MSSYKLGIDFGTSNSTCAVYDGKQAEMIALEGGSPMLPSAMFFGNKGEVFFGRKAVSAYMEGETGRFMRGLKSILGTSLMKEKTLINKKYVDFSEIIAIYMRQLKKRAEEHVGQTITDVVLGRPVHFHDNNPDADSVSEETLKQIAESLGFKNICFQYEPIAAAFTHERTLKKDQLALVVDLGGGTSDFTVIRLSPDKTSQINRADDILSTSGVRVGGTNFDQKLSIKSFMPHLGLGSEYCAAMDKSKILPLPSSVYYQLSEWSQVNFGQTPKAVQETKILSRTAIEPEKMDRLLYIQESGLGHALLQAVENTKIALTDLLEVDVNLSNINLDVEMKVTRPEFEAAISEKILHISMAIDECIEKSGVQADMVSLIVLTGGSSELPIINTMIAEKFPSAEISNNNKFGSVGLGLAYNAKYAFA